MGMRLSFEDCIVAVRWAKRHWLVVSLGATLSIVGVLGQVADMLNWAHSHFDFLLALPEHLVWRWVFLLIPIALIVRASYLDKRRLEYATTIRQEVLAIPMAAIKIFCDREKYRLAAAHAIKVDMALRNYEDQINSEENRFPYSDRNLNLGCALRSRAEAVLGEMDAFAAMIDQQDWSKPPLQYPCRVGGSVPDGQHVQLGHEWLTRDLNGSYIAAHRGNYGTLAGQWGALKGNLALIANRADEAADALKRQINGT